MKDWRVRGQYRCRRLLKERLPLILGDATPVFPTTSIVGLVILSCGCADTVAQLLLLLEAEDVSDHVICSRLGNYKIRHPVMVRTKKNSQKCRGRWLVGDVLKLGTNCSRRRHRMIDFMASAAYRDSDLAPRRDDAAFKRLREYLKLRY